MRYRFTGAVVATTLAAAVLLTVAPIAQQGRGNAPAAPAAGQGRGAARPAQIAGRPNLNGVWHAIGSAHWNLEDHSAAAAGPRAATASCSATRERMPSMAACRGSACR